MMNALGLLEVNGLTASIEAADTMLKTAAVRLVNQTFTSPGLVTLVIEGDLAACRAALDAGAAAASRIGRVLVKKEIGRPELDTEWFVNSFTKRPVPTPKKNISAVTHVETIEQPIESEKVEEINTSTSRETEFSQVTLLAYITEHVQGRNVTDIINHFNVSRTDIKSMLKDCISQGKVHKRGNRYYSVDTKK